MKAKTHSRSNRENKQSTKLIWACAWCDESTYTTLKKGQHYTHGICTIHKLKLIVNFRKTLGVRA